MRRLLTLVFLAAVAVPAAAQVTPRARPARPPRDSTTRERGYSYSIGPEGVRVQVLRRGRLGLLVDLTPDPARDSIGARVAGVTPGGPSEKAGVHTGDIVVRLNGTRLAGTESTGRPGASEDEDRESRPGGRLIELASRLETGDTVHLDLQRDNHPLNVTLVAGESGMEDITRRLMVEALPRLTRLPFRGGETVFSLSRDALANLELVKVNPGLGEYFGTSEGLLVVDAPSDSSLGLKAGDVILGIGGRRPSSPAQAMRILGTYESNETVSFEVMRMKRRITVTGKMPDRAAWRSFRNSFDLDLPFERVMPEGELLRDLRGMELPQMELPRVELPRAKVRMIKHEVET
jgi:hypothetical protein